MLKLFAALIVAGSIGYGVHALAQGRVNLRPAVTPISSSSSNGISFAWFYDATDGNVYMCRSAQGKDSEIQCKSTSKLP